MKFDKVKTFVLILFCIVSVSLQAQTESDNDDTVKDIDGNVYHTVKIGKQEWMVENLKVSRYNSGKKIPDVGDVMNWSSLESAACCDYDNSPLSNDTYGKLYNFYTIESLRNLCPSGWHVPSDNDWTKLSTYLGVADSVGIKLKGTGFDFWPEPNAEATNETGFTGLPGGNRSSNGSFAFKGTCGYWWSSTKFNKKDGWARYLFSNSNKLLRSNSSFGTAFSVRCLKD